MVKVKPDPCEPEPAPEIEPRPYVDEFGFVTDATTDIPIGHSRFPTDFAITDQEAAELLLAELHLVDVRIAGLRYERQIQTDRINAFYDKQIRRSDRRRKWLLWRYWPQASQWAREQIGNLKRGKTIDLLFGKISLRSVSGRIAIRSGVETKTAWHGDGTSVEDQLPALLMWAEDMQPGTLKHSIEFQISRLPGGIDLPREFFERTPDGETLTIDTGAGKATESDVAEPQPAEGE